MECPYNVCGMDLSDHDDCAMQYQEVRAETFAAEAAMGLAPGTTEGWYDEPEDPFLRDEEEHMRYGEDD